MKKLKHLIEKETVLCISAFLALLSMAAIPPSKAYLSYIDFRVLAILFCLMAVIAGFSRLGVFQLLAQLLVEKTTGLKGLIFILVFLCFLTSMLITNDVALITFVPLAILIVGVAGQNKLIFTVVMQTIAANLGSMLTPVGNPQNLYLYAYYKLSIREFLSITAPIWLVGLVLTGAILLIGKNQSVHIAIQGEANITHLGKLAGYIVLFPLCLLTVLHIVPYGLTLAIITIAILMLDRKLFWDIDYGLLATFVCFFVLVGNLQKIPAIQAGVRQVVQGHEFVAAVVASQIISNVPAAFMLSSFTDQGAALIQGTNIGGLGTLIASLASLISFKLYAKSQGANPRRYLLIFTLLNAVFLAVILVVLFVLNLV